ncbi:hypothetical protein KSP40_PGU015517 [Platanthera guangdongensis]|uniref:Uncharacterized protein n=1 Tax=Platanthera guangdongensis TaxID=2320717 RepID=A0ABR2LLP9_9ASPA
MSCSFILLTITTILLVVVPSHTAISFPQIPTSELIRTYCNVIDNLDVYPHDVIQLIPLHSSAPIVLLPNTLYCMASTISNETRNMSSVHGATAESSLDIKHGSSIQRYNLLASAKVVSLHNIDFDSRPTSSSGIMSCMKVYPEVLVASVRFYDGDVKPNETIEMYLEPTFSLQSISLHRRTPPLLFLTNPPPPKVVALFPHFASLIQLAITANPIPDARSSPGYLLPLPTQSSNPPYFPSKPPQSPP